MNPELQAKRNEAALAEVREMRAQALAGSAETMTNRAVALRLDLFDCMSENALLKAKLAEVAKENESLKAQIADGRTAGRNTPDVEGASGRNLERHDSDGA